MSTTYMHDIKVLRDFDCDEIVDYKELYCTGLKRVLSLNDELKDVVNRVDELVSNRGEHIHIYNVLPSLYAEFDDTDAYCSEISADCRHLYLYTANLSLQVYCNLLHNLAVNHDFYPMLEHTGLVSMTIEAGERFLVVFENAKREIDEWVNLE
ncbi:hypothetical protein BCV33_21270 [Vibrio lentus]|uniref:hypothetical protein n=1 Tax=Vibrio TaxID=662 RepID=UPI000C848D65|nr:MULTISPECIES: hypothetical protein [Vibrio]PME61926.1 hypothetical protein BCV33_21270 [Vibrio lentus]